MAHEPFAYIGAAIKAQQRYAVDVSDAGATHKSLSAQAQQCYLMNKCWLYKPLCLDGKLLKYTVINPNAAYPQTPENHLNVTYAYNNGDGWNPVLITIKQVVEADWQINLPQVLSAYSLTSYRQDTT